MKPVPIQQYGEVIETQRCSCGAGGKPFLTLAGGKGYVCSQCFVRELGLAFGKRLR